MSTHRALAASLCLALALAVATVAGAVALSRIEAAAATAGCGNATCTSTPTPTSTAEPPTVAPASVAPASRTPETTATATPTPDAAPATGILPYVIEGPPPEVIEKIRAGQMPGVTLADLAQSQQNVLGAPALASVNQAAPSGTPIVGVDHGITILVQYADLAASPASTQSSFQSMLFGTDPGSMRTYYRENSYNQYDIQGDVTNWVTVAHNQKWYADYDGIPNSIALCGLGDDYGCGPDPAHSSQTLIRDAVLAADPYVDFSAYAQGGVVRNLMIIHAGMGAEANPSCRTCAWSVAWGPAAPLVADGVSIESAFVAPEYTYTPGDSTIGVYAHEFGHLAFGLPDLYDSDYSSSGVGYWSLMGFGNWLNGGATPAHLDAWSKIHNGWLTPTVISADGPINIPAAETSATAYKLWANGAPSNEYFLVENRQQTGFDTYLPGSGLLIWHVDDSVYINNADCHPHVLLVPADSGVIMPCSDGYGSSSTPWPGTLFRSNWNGATVPGSRAYSGAQSAVAVMSISPSALVMTANVSVSGTSLFNDNIAAPTDILATPFSETLDTTAATAELGEPAPCGGVGKTLWYRYTPAVSPPAPVEVTVDTVGSSFDTVLAVYAQTSPTSPPGGLALVDCNDNTDGLGNQSRITFIASPGYAYYIQAGGAGGASGQLVFNADLGPPKGGISGTIIDRNAVPVAGAMVQASPSGCCGGSYASAITDADGAYTITGLISGDYVLYASAAGYAGQYYSGTYHYYEATAVTVAPNAVTAGIDFILEPAAHISGTVVDELGTPIAGAWISVESQICCDGAWAMTAPDGSYHVDTLAPGTYRVRAEAAGFAGEYYDNTYDAAAAQLIVATSGANITGIDFALAAGARISGTITNAFGTPIADAFVAADRAGGGGTGYASSAADGTYLINTLPSGSYRVYAQAPGYQRQFYSGALDEATATLVAASSGAETSGINFALLEGGKISGTITNALGTPIAGAYVTAERDGGGGYGGGFSAFDGVYLIDSLPAGDYRVVASATGYLNTYYGGETLPWLATLVPVSNGVESMGVNIALQQGGSISGKIIDALGTPIAGAQVYAERVTGYGAGVAYTASDGTYLIGQLPAGDYKVAASASGYLGQYYGGTDDWNVAALVAVSGGIETAGIDIELPRGARISGTVTNALATPLAGIDVWAAEVGGGGFGGYGHATTEPDGTYVIDTLAAGNFRVSARGAGYPTQYYDGVYDWYAATLVATNVGSETAGIDFALEEGGKVSGTVTDELGTPVAGAYVYASRDDGSDAASTSTGPDGAYTIVGLSAGNYRVSAWKSGYARQYYNGSYDYYSAGLVATSLGSLTTGIDFALTLTGRVSGTVTDVNGAPIVGAYVMAESGSCCDSNWGVTGADGTYVIDNLGPIAYRLMASAAGYAPRYFFDTYDLDAATLVTPPSGGEASGYDFVLEVGGSISGTVRDNLGAPIIDAMVWASSDVCCGGGGAFANPDGTYTIHDLAPGNYVVSSNAYGYLPQYWDHVAGVTSATLLPVSSGSNTNSIDFTLSPPDPDNSVTPKDIFAFPFTDNRDTTAASLEPGEQQPCGDVGATIWYRLTTPYSPPGATTVTVDAAGSDFDTVVAVYTPDYSSPSPPGGLALVGCSAAGLRSWQTFTADPGTVYYIQVGGQSGATGNLVVHAGVDSDADGLRDDVETNTGVYIAPSDAGSNPAVVDTDGDACGDGQEVLGLYLNPVNKWDFYSVPIPALFKAASPLGLHPDAIVGAADAQAVFAYFKVAAKVGTAEYEADHNGNGVKDGVEYDRSFVGPGQSGPADGTVSASDAQLAFAQFKKKFKC